MVKTAEQEAAEAVDFFSRSKEIFPGAIREKRERRERREREERRKAEREEQRRREAEEDAARQLEREGSQDEFRAEGREMRSKSRSYRFVACFLLVHQDLYD